jgi:hypothetical protein
VISEIDHEKHPILKKFISLIVKEVEDNDDDD